MQPAYINGTSLAVRGALQTEQVMGGKEETIVKGFLLLNSRKISGRKFSRERCH